MAVVRFTPHLRTFFDLPETAQAEARTLGELVGTLDGMWPGLGFYVTDEQGRLRKHVAVWIDGKRVKERDCMDRALQSESEVHILQALSGG